ncbi:MAG: hypothetical protein KDE34_06640 [Anaerolineales bacterium]|nr:hypothetical protein [Anaerolineales bacterium]
MATPSAHQIDGSLETTIPLAPHVVRRHLRVAVANLIAIVLSLTLIFLLRQLLVLWLIIIFLGMIFLPTALLLWWRHRKHQLFLTPHGLRIVRQDETIELRWAEIDAIYLDVPSNTLMLHRPAGDVYLPMSQIAQPEKLRADIEARLAPNATSAEAQNAAWPLINQFRQLVSLPEYSRSTPVRAGTGAAFFVMLLILLLIPAIIAYNQEIWLWFGVTGIAGGVLVYGLYHQPRQLSFSQEGIQLQFRRRQAGIAWADIEAVQLQGESFVLIGSKRNLSIPNERRWRGETTRRDMQIYLTAQLWVRQIPVRRSSVVGRRWVAPVLCVSLV